MFTPFPRSLAILTRRLHHSIAIVVPILLVVSNLLSSPSLPLTVRRLAFGFNSFWEARISDIAILEGQNVGDW